MSTLDELNRLHEAATNSDIQFHRWTEVADNAWPAIHRVLVAARGLMEANNVNNWVFTSDGKLTDHGKLFEALRALDGHQG